MVGAPVVLAHPAPQWSPPLIGGSTFPEKQGTRHGTSAAMEPAVDRREHGIITVLIWVGVACRNGARR